MVAPRNKKLNRLQSILPEGLVVDSAWLEAQGYKRSLRVKYTANGWLVPVATGVFRRPVAGLGHALDQPYELTWELVVISLQNLMQVPTVVGGRTALELQGFAHYLPTAPRREVHLYSAAPLPSWLDTVPVNVEWKRHSADRLFEGAGRQLSHLAANLKTGALVSADPLHGHPDVAALSYGVSRWPLTVSTPERAALELVDEVPAHETFEQADAVLSGLRTLSPRRLQKLLEDCRSIRTKRLFLWFAERHNHAWVKHLDRARINLGRGKRSLVAGGRLDPTYNITVPASMSGEASDVQ